MGSFFFHAGKVFLSQSSQSSLSLLAHILSAQDSGPSPNPSPAGRGVICEVTPTGLLAYFVTFISLTDLTDLTELFHPRFELTEGLWHTDITERYC